MLNNIFNIEFVFYIFIFFIGSSIGSFLNVLSYRLPLHISIVRPCSYCPACKKTIRILHLIPIISFLFLLGRCSNCKIKISWRYPIIELLAGIGTLFIGIKYYALQQFIFIIEHNFSYISQSLPIMLAALWIFYTGIVLSDIDLKYKILPDKITLSGIIIGIILSSLNPLNGFLYGVLGALNGFFILFLISKLYLLIRKKEGMGFGDVKYLTMIGAVVGWKGVFLTLFLSSIIGSIVGILLGIIKREGLGLALPFGPFLALSAIIVTMYQNEILSILFSFYGF